MYDIYLLSECHILPDLSDLVASDPLFVDLDLSTGIQSALFKSGFIGLNLPANTAASLLEHLKKAGGSGVVVPLAYRQPKITIEMAYAIAFQALAEQKQATGFSSHDYEPLSFCKEGVMWWEFKSNSEKLIQQGYIPGRVCIRVDKLDGHVWTWEEEQRYLYGEEYYLESATTQKPMQVLHFLSEQLGFELVTNDQKNNQTCLKGSGLVVEAVKHTFPQVIEEMYGFKPTVHLQFRIIPYTTGFEWADILVLRAVMILLGHEPGDAVLVFNAWFPLIILQRISGQLVLNKGGLNWNES
jgi:hypothetical protein